MARQLLEAYARRALEEHGCHQVGGHSNLAVDGARRFVAYSDDASPAVIQVVNAGQQIYDLPVVQLARAASVEHDIPRR